MESLPRSEAAGLPCEVVLGLRPGIWKCTVGCRPTVPGTFEPTPTEAEEPGSPAVSTVQPTVNRDETDLRTYVNQEYGFSFRYPSGWQVIEGRNFVSICSLAVDDHVKE